MLACRARQGMETEKFNDILKFKNIRKFVVALIVMLIKAIREFLLLTPQFVNYTQYICEHFKQQKPRERERSIQMIYQHL